ncbi:unnamed protein product [Aspergillus oryzae]|uniref:Unnamed protein product n=2 Tax=Aspergillus oryzae TaxID=5062 RepID=A0AAN4YQX1_ASPOZ|nr:unnamed protein product [Aspergillus oryzae]GMF97240.1 unnamed protein product [Aspergillus oryzae]GMG04174.1 unnamed protein product [Aspergillus oryzae]GMG35483.1 unnamed protein product [Aspergillus oryzae]GMG44620.1 unnamed protein product [Aspergillus oryzae var. brunneus]
MGESLLASPGAEINLVENSLTVIPALLLLLGIFQFRPCGGLTSTKYDMVLLMWVWGLEGIGNQCSSIRTIDDQLTQARDTDRSILGCAECPDLHPYIPGYASIQLHCNIPKTRY